MSVAGLTAFGDAKSPEHPSWIISFVFCGDRVQACDLQYSWDKVTRKSHHPDSVSCSLQTPGFLQHPPRYKVETEKTTHEKKHAWWLQGQGHCPVSSRTTEHFVLVEAASGQQGCWGCTCVGRSTGSYPWPAETDEDEILSFFWTRFISLGTALHASQNRSEFSHRSRKTQKALLSVNYHITSSCQVVSYLHTCAQLTAGEGEDTQL